jgi:putative hydrolase of the HAD superfamily
VDETLVDRKAALVLLFEYFIDKYSGDYPYEGSREELINYMIEIDENGYSGLEKFFRKLNMRWKLPHSVKEFIKERNDIFGGLTVPFPEMLEVLECLKGKYKLGIITNGYSSVQREKIRKVNITEYFDDIIVSGEQPFAKPDPRIFELACKNLGVKPEEAIFVGDYYPNDIAGALSAKIMPIWISNNPDEHKEYQGIRVKCLKDILKYL